jgi:hypothetical protein
MFHPQEIIGNCPKMNHPEYIDTLLPLTPYPSENPSKESSIVLT